MQHSYDIFLKEKMNQGRVTESEDNSGKERGGNSLEKGY